ncbi:ABC transporter substrate-binding protein [Candidatus Bipolaricaulota bacterium]|nr:ABC transporter substrate-binding protein [Candidatus Bipolaricaulota bacterium]
MKERHFAYIITFLCTLLLLSSVVTARESNLPAEPQIVPLGEESELWKMRNLKPGNPGGSVEFSVQNFPETFNNLLGDKKRTKEVTRVIMGSGLIAENPVNGRIVPGLAKSWSISEDGRSYTFHLRKGLKFSDGKPLTAEDVIFTYRELVFNPEVETEKRSILRIDNQLPEIKKLDALTVRFKIPKPYGPFLRSVSTGIYPRHVFKGVSSAEFNEAWGLKTAADKPEKIVGAGPFQLKNYVPDEEIVFSRNPYYYKTDPAGTQLPYLNRYRVFKVKDNDIEFLKFKNDETDLLRAQLRDMPYLLSNMKEEGWKITTGEGDCGLPLNSDFLTFNWKAKGKELRTIFRDPDFRRAVSLVIDRERLINEVFNSFGRIQFGPISRLSPYHNPRVRELVPSQYDPDRARKLLKGIGVSDRNNDGFLEFESGERISFSILVNKKNRVRSRSAKIISDGLKEIGITAEVKLKPFETFSSKLIGGGYQAAIVRVLSHPVEPSTLSDIFTTEGPLHLWHPNANTNPADWEEEIDKLFRLGLKAQGFKSRKSHYDRFQEIYAEKLPVIYLPGESFLFATDSSLRNTGKFSRLGTFTDFAEFVWVKK